jgi:hypothetical protein
MQCLLVLGRVIRPKIPIDYETGAVCPRARRILNRPRREVRGHDNIMIVAHDEKNAINTCTISSIVLHAWNELPLFYYTFLISSKTRTGDSARHLIKRWRLQMARLATFRVDP